MAPTRDSTVSCLNTAYTRSSQIQSYCIRFCTYPAMWRKVILTLDPHDEYLHISSRYTRYVCTLHQFIYKKKLLVGMGSAQIELAQKSGNLNMCLLLFVMCCALCAVWFAERMPDHQKITNTEHFSWLKGAYTHRHEKKTVRASKSFLPRADGRVCFLTRPTKIST